MNKTLQTPTPHDIEAALSTMRDGTSAFGRWVRLDTQDTLDEANAMADGLWWVSIVRPDGAEECCGAGTTSSEAAAVAWINVCVSAWWTQGPRLRDEDYAKVPRRVAEGWRFELYEAPVRPELSHEKTF
jgi:hypothetical protein